MTNLIPKLEFRIPISPNEKYMRMLYFFIKSAKLFGGNIAAKAHYVVVVGEDIEPFDLKKKYQWTNDYSIDFIWVDRALFRKDTYDATGYQRFFVESNADIIAMVDVDLLFTGNIDNVIIESYEKQCLSGFIAHISPFDNADNKIASELLWDRLFLASKIDKPLYKFQHTGWGLMSTNPLHQFCPEYFNYGFILAPKHITDKMGKSFQADLKIVNSVFNTWFASQIVNTLTINKNKIKCISLSMNYNFPLHIPETAIRKINFKDKHHPKDIKVFHYLGNGTFNKSHFETKKTLEIALKKKDLEECAKYFQIKLQEVYDTIS